MKKRLYYLQLIVLLTLLWHAFFESFALSILLSGLVISSFSIWLTERYLLHDRLFDLYPFNILKLIRFAIFLLGEIYKSGLSIIPTIITGKANPDMIEIYTELESNLDLVVLSNAITLTPGTITVDLEGHRLLVLWMDPKTKHPTLAGKIIKGSIEKRIKEGL